MKHIPRTDGPPSKHKVAFFLGKTLVVLLALAFGAGGGIGISYLIFFWPVLKGTPDLMLGWGWVGWVPALAAGISIFTILTTQIIRVGFKCLNKFIVT